MVFAFQARDNRDARCIPRWFLRRARHWTRFYRARTIARCPRPGADDRHQEVGARGLGQENYRKGLIADFAVTPVSSVFCQTSLLSHRCEIPLHSASPEAAWATDNSCVWPGDSIAQAAWPVVLDCGNLPRRPKTPKELVLKGVHFGRGFCAPQPQLVPFQTTRVS